MRQAFPTRRLRYLADVNPPVPDHVRLDQEAEYRLLPMEAIREFSPPGNGYKRPAQELLSGYSYIEPTDVAYAKVTPCFENGKGLVGADLDEPVFATTEVTVLRPRDEVDQRFLSYMVRSAAFRNPAISSMTGAGGLRRVSESYIKDLPLPAPSAWMQPQIADYLDHETAEIDAFISHQSRLIELLDERRMATAGELIRYPAHFDDGQLSRDRLAPLKHLGTIALGKMLDTKQLDSTSTMHPYLRAANVQPLGELKLDDLKKMRFTNHEKQALTVLAGDVVVVEGGVGGFGRAAYVPKDLPGVGFQNSIIRIRPNSKSDGRFIAYALILLRHRGYINTVSSVASMPHFTSEKVARTPVPHLSKARQAEIADELDSLWRTHSTASADARMAIDLARERRAALITAAVTGQIDVTARNKPAAEKIEDDVAQGLHREYA